MAESSAGSIRAGRAYVELGADSRELEDKVKKGQSLLKQLKQGLGEESKLGGLGKILAGTGAVAGLALGARLLNDMAQAAVKWRDAMEKGGIESGKATEELIQSIPVLGQIRQAGVAIRELMTGEQAAAARITEEAERTNKAMDERVNFQKALLKLTNEQADAMRRLQLAANLIGAGPDRATIEAQARQEDERIAREQRAEVEREKARADTGREADPIRKQLRDLEARRAVAAEKRMPGDRGPLVGPDDRYDNLKALREIEADIATHQQNLAGINRRGAERIAQIDKGLAAETAQAARNALSERLEAERKAGEESAKGQRERARETRQAEDQITAIESQAEQDRLRAQGENFRADLEQLRQSYRERRGEAQRQAGTEADQLETGDTAGRAGIQARLDRELQALAQAERAAETLLRREARERTTQWLDKVGEEMFEFFFSAGKKAESMGSIAKRHEAENAYQLESFVNDLSEGTRGAARDFSAAGTFNPFAAGSLSGGPLAKIERHTKDTADALNDIRNRGGGITYQ